MTNDNKLSTVYLIRNKVNPKVYVGVTTRDPDERYAEHVKAARRNDLKRGSPLLVVAMNEIGIPNFYYEIIEEVPSEQGFDMERYWIRFYASNDERYGYNENGGNTIPATYKKEYDAKYKREHPEKCRASTAKWYHAHKDEINRRRREERAAKRALEYQTKSEVQTK